MKSKGYRQMGGTMIRHPELEGRNINRLFYESEARRIAEMNRVIGNMELTKEEEKVMVWIAGWDEFTLQNILSVMEKVKQFGKKQSRESVVKKLWEKEKEMGGYAQKRAM